MSIDPLKSVLPGIRVFTCDINCQMRAYRKITSVLLKNVENVERLPGKIYFIIYANGQNSIVPTFSCFQVKFQECDDFSDSAISEGR